MIVHALTIPEFGQIFNLSVERVATDPTDIKTPGRVWYNTTDQMIKFSYEVTEGLTTKIKVGMIGDVTGTHENIRDLQSAVRLLEQGSATQEGKITDHDTSISQNEAAITANTTSISDINQLIGVDPLTTINAAPIFSQDNISTLADGFVLLAEQLAKKTIYQGNIRVITDTLITHGSLGTTNSLILEDVTVVPGDVVCSINSGSIGLFLVGERFEELVPQIGNPYKILSGAYRNYRVLFNSAQDYELIRLDKTVDIIIPWNVQEYTTYKSGTNNYLQVDNTCYKFSLDTKQVTLITKDNVVVKKFFSDTCYLTYDNTFIHNNHKISNVLDIYMLDNNIAYVGTDGVYQYDEVSDSYSKLPPSAGTWVDGDIRIIQNPAKDKTYYVYSLFNGINHVYQIFNKETNSELTLTSGVVFTSLFFNEIDHKLYILSTNGTNYLIYSLDPDTEIISQVAKLGLDIKNDISSFYVTSDAIFFLYDQYLYKLKLSKILGADIEIMPIPEINVCSDNLSKLINIELSTNAITMVSAMGVSKILNY